MAEKWLDLTGERALFAQHLILDLDALSVLIEGGSAPTTTRPTVLKSLSINVAHAVEWANQNNYVQFGRYLVDVAAFVDLMRAIN